MYKKEEEEEEEEEEEPPPVWVLSLYKSWMNEIYQYQHLYGAFCQRMQSAVSYYYGIRKIVTVISLHLTVLLAKWTSYQHLDCNISHNR